MVKSNQQTSFRQEDERFLSRFHSSTQKFSSEYRRIYCGKPRAKDLCVVILTELEKSVLDGNVANFKHFSKLLGYIGDVESRTTLITYYNGTDNSLKTNNLVILACKHDRVEILKHIFSNTAKIFENVSLHAGKDVITPDDKDETCHDAFYYAIRSNDVELLDVLMKKWPGNYFDTRPEKLDEILSRAYEELKLKNVSLSDEMEVFAESKLINLRFFSTRSGQLPAAKDSLRRISERINLVLNSISLLKSEYSYDKNIDAKFVCIGRFIAHNVHILKRLLKLTYDRLPWEEIEFCLIAFISSYVKPREINLFYRSVLDKNKILLYLDEFAKKLAAEKPFIESLDVGQLANLPKLKREVVVAQIIRNDPQFLQLFNDHQQIRDIHSLETVRDYLNLALSIDPNEREGQLIIIRGLQVIGEYLKNTLESPELSKATSELLLLSLPHNTRQLIIDLRNSLSHAYSLSKRTEIEENTTADFFIGVQNDVKRIDNVIIDILYANKMKMIEEMLIQIISSDKLDEIRSITEVLRNVEFNTTISNDFEMMELEKLQKLIQELKDAIPDQTNYEKDLFSEADTITNSTRNKSKNIAHDYRRIFHLLQSLSFFSCDNLDQDGINATKHVAKKILNNLVARVEFHDFKKIVELLTCIVHSATPRLQDDNLDTVNGLTSEILLIARIKMNDTKWIENLREKLYGKTSFTSVPHQSKPQTVTRNKYDQQLTNKVFELKSILKKDLSGGKLIDYKRNEKLQAVVEMLVLDIMSLLSTSEKHLENNHFFLDDNSPLLTGKCLRNHLAHGNTLLEVLLSDPSLAVVLNAEKLVSENIVQGKKKVGKLIPDDPTKLSLKYDQDLVTITNQDNMFAALVKGDLDELKSCLAKGADINARSIELSTALHFAAQGPNLNVVKFVVDHSPANIITAKDAADQTPLHVATAHGKINIVKFFLSQASVPVNDPDGHGRTPLHIAAKNGHRNIVEFLLKNNADTDIQDNSGYAALHHAVRNNRIDTAKLLLSEEPHVDLNEAMGGYTSLHLAAVYNRLELVDFLLKNGANPNTKDDRGATPLHSAAVYGRLEVANSLMLKGARVDARKFNGCTPLHDAIAKGHTDVVKVLLNRGADANAVEKIYNHTPLHYAARYGREEIVEILIKNKANVAVVTGARISPLHYAAEFGHLKVVELLLKSGVDIRVRDDGDSTALHYAAQHGRVEVVKFLLQNGLDVDEKAHGNFTPLHKASLANRATVVDFLIKNKAEVNHRNDDGNSPLFLAAQHGSKAVVEVLLKNNAQVSSRCVEGFTALHAAAMNGHYDIAALLIKHGANVNAKSNNGLGPLHGAILKGQKEIAHLLIKNKADVQLNSKMGMPLVAAVDRGHKEIVEILIANKASVNFVFDGLTPLRYAIRNNRTEIVEILAANGANVNEPQAEPLASAVFNGNKDIVDILLKYKARVNVKNFEDDTPLHMAAHQGHTEIVSLLVSKGADVNAITNAVHRTLPIHLAANEGHIDVIKVLVENGARFDVANVAGTPLSIAAGQGKAKVVEFLLSKGEKIGKDHLGRTPFELAAGSGHLEVMKVLLQNKEINLNASGINGCTLLHIASQAKNVELMKYLVDMGSDVNVTTSTGLKAIHLAASAGSLQAVEFFLSKGLDVDELGFDNRTVLFYSVSRDHIELTEYLIANGADVNRKNDNDLTPLHIAAESASKRIVEILLRNGAMYNALDNRSRSPLVIANGRSVDPKTSSDKADIVNLLSSIEKLFDAVKRNCPSDVEKFIKAGALVDARNTKATTPLHYAAWKGCSEIVRILLESKANPNSVGSDGFSPLHYAVKFSHLDCVKILMHHGATYNVVSQTGKTPLDFAKDKSIIDLFEAIDDSFEKIRNNNGRIIKDLNKIRDRDTLKAIMNARNGENKSLIAAAVQSNFSNIVDLKQVSQGDVTKEIDEAILQILKGDYRQGQATLNRLYEKRKQILGIILQL